MFSEYIQTERLALSVYADSVQAVYTDAVGKQCRILRMQTCSDAVKHPYKCFTVIRKCRSLGRRRQVDISMALGPLGHSTPNAMSSVPIG